jgi:hypothetical protein
MSDFEQPEKELLERARRGLSPGLDDQRRVLAATLAAASVAAGVASSSGVAAGASLPSSRLVKHLVGVLALGLVGAAGYGWGYHAGITARPTPAVAPPVVAIAPLPAKEPAPPLAAERSPFEPELPAPPRALAQSKSSAGEAKSNAAASAAGSAPSPGLDEEVRQLRRIERAIRDGNPRLALVLAEEQERTMPNGQLKSERSAAAMMASCQLQAEGAVARAARFIAENPNSSYVARLREICKLPVDPQRN